MRERVPRLKPSHFKGDNQQRRSVVFCAEYDTSIDSIVQAEGAAEVANGSYSPGVAGPPPASWCDFRHPPPEDDHDISDDISLHSIWRNLASAESIILIWTLSPDGCDRAFRAPAAGVFQMMVVSVHDLCFQSRYVTDYVRHHQGSSP